MQLATSPRYSQLIALDPGSFGHIAVREREARKQAREREH